MCTSCQSDPCPWHAVAWLDNVGAAAAQWRITAAGSGMGGDNRDAEVCISRRPRSITLSWHPLSTHSVCATSMLACRTFLCAPAACALSPPCCPDSDVPLTPGHRQTPLKPQGATPSLRLETPRVSTEGNKATRKYGALRFTPAAGLLENEFSIALRQSCPAVVVHRASMSSGAVATAPASGQWDCRQAACNSNGGRHALHTCTPCTVM